MRSLLPIEGYTMLNNIHIITDEEIQKLDIITYEDLEKEILGMLIC